MAASLPPDLRFVAVDLPGHGHSSPKPGGMFYHRLDWVADVRRVVRHLGWSAFSVVAHSLGCPVTLAYAGCFPAEVRRIVALDGIKFVDVPPEDLSENTARAIERLLNCDIPQLEFRPEDAVRRVVDGYGGSVTEESARILMKRGCRPTGNGPLVTFARDWRLKMCITMPALTREQHRALARNVRCHLMFVVPNRGRLATLGPQAEIDELLEIYAANAKSFRLVRLDGTHHFHLNNPAPVALHIKEFLNVQRAVPTRHITLP